MNITLTAAHQLSLSDAVPLHRCLGVLTLAACVRERNLDCTLQVPDLAQFHHMGSFDFAAIMEKAAGCILEYAPDLACFSTMSTNLVFALELCRLLKEKKPGVKTLLGGPGVSFCAPEVLGAYQDVDYIIRGEADRAFPDFVEKLINDEDISSLKGLVYLKEGQLIDNKWPEPVQDLDSVPVPAFDLCSTFETEKGAAGDYNGICLEAGRGCPYDCSFCSTSRFFNRKYRTKPVERMVREIEEVQKITGTGRIIFNHDLLTFSKAYVDELCRALQKNFPHLVWKCHSRIDKVDRDLLSRMREAGCNEIFFGIECATERMQKKIGKNLKLDRLPEVIEALVELDFTFSLSFITGFPGEKPEDLTALLHCALQAQYTSREKGIIKIHTLVPLAGSRLHSKMQDKLMCAEYGSYGTSDIPALWDDFKKTIKTNSTIFSPYYYFETGTEHRRLAVTLELIGLALQNHLRASLLAAYELLAAGLPEKIIQNSSQLVLPGTDTIENTDFTGFNSSLCSLISSFFEAGSKEKALFDTVSTFETALYEVKNKPGTVKIIETFYNPAAVVKNFNSRIPLSLAPESTAKRFFMISRDRDDGKIKSVEIDESLKAMFE